MTQSKYIYEAQGLNPLGLPLGDVIRLIFNSDDSVKNNINKAIWYLNHYIQRLKTEAGE